MRVWGRSVVWYVSQLPYKSAGAAVVCCRGGGAPTSWQPPVVCGLYAGSGVCVKAMASSPSPHLPPSRSVLLLLCLTLIPVLRVIARCADSCVPLPHLFELAGAIPTPKAAELKRRHERKSEGARQKCGRCHRAASSCSFTQRALCTSKSPRKVSTPPAASFSKPASRNSKTPPTAPPTCAFRAHHAAHA